MAGSVVVDDVRFSSLFIPGFLKDRVWDDEDDDDIRAFRDATKKKEEKETQV